MKRMQVSEGTPFQYDVLNIEDARTQRSLHFCLVGFARFLGYKMEPPKAREPNQKQFKV